MKQITFFLTVLLFLSCTQTPKNNTAKSSVSAEMDKPLSAQQFDSIARRSQYTENDSVRKIVNFIFKPENKNLFASQKFLDSSQSVEAVSIIGSTVYTLYYDKEWNYLAISTRPNRKKYTALERFSCADINLDGDPEFGNIGDPNTPKNKTKYYATSLFASSDENQFVEYGNYWQHQYSIFLKDIVTHYKL